MSKLRLSRLAGFAIAAGVVAGATPAFAASVADTLTSSPEFTKLTSYVMRGNMLESFRGSTPITVFAPVDSAFDRMPTVGVFQHKSSAQPNDIMGITDVVREHVVAGSHLPAEFLGQKVEVTDAFGSRLVVDGSSGNRITVTTTPSLAGGTNSTSTGYNAPRTAVVIGQPIVADNGVIYPIDNVLSQ